MARFLDLNYYCINTDNPDYILRKHEANLGYLDYLPKDMEVSVFYRIKTNNFFSLNGIDYVFHKPRTFRIFDSLIYYHRLIKKYNPDFILIHGMRYGFNSFMLKRILMKKVIIIVQVHGFAPAPKILKKLLYKWISKYVDGYLFTGNENARPWINSGVFDKGKVFKIMEGSTSFKFNPDSKRKTQSFIWVGRLDKNKDPLTILKAFNAYLLDSPNATLTMIYNAHDLLAEVQSLINLHDNLKNAVTLKGEIEHNELELLYNQHQYFLLGSHYEGSGYAMVEAMACGCVPIVTKIPSFEFMTNNGDCGLLFSAGNSKELLFELRKTLEIDYANLRSKVLNQVKNKLSHEAIANDIAKTFHFLAKK